MQTEYPYASGWLHQGFLKAFQALAAGGLNSKIQSLFSARPWTDILVTGHSLGGALAQVAALELKSNPIYSSNAIGAVNVITFGSPRWANRDLATYFDATMDSNWRIVNENDMAPTVPFSWMGYYYGGEYYHTSPEIRYTDADAGTYEECQGDGEEWNCMYVVGDIDDHLNYLNVWLGYTPCGDSSFSSVSEYRSSDSITCLQTETAKEASQSQGLVLHTVSLVALVTVLLVGWLAALIFFCFWRKAQASRSGVSKYQVADADAEHDEDDECEEDDGGVITYMHVSTL